MSGSPAGSDAPGRRRDRLAGWLVGRYFDVSYSLLAGSEAGRRLLRQTGPSGEAAHGYATPEDLDALVIDLAPRPGDQLLDLGSGVGGIARAVHRRSGAGITGIDASSRAVAIATRDARDDGLGDRLRFMAGSIAHPPPIGAAGAYAFDSLMFLPDPSSAIRRIGEALVPVGRLFATLVVLGPDPHARLGRMLAATGVQVERLDEVTGALRDRSRARSAAARGLLRRRSATIRGRSAMLLVILEEAFMQMMISRHCAGRFRFLVSYRADDA
jgi:SAM-dependent methyltransferase